MQHARMTVALFAFTAMAGAAAAQEAQKAALPDTTPCPEAIAAIASCYGVKHETGAYITAAVPKNWNGHLVVFAHGGPSLLPPTATGSKTDLVSIHSINDPQVVVEAQSAYLDAVKAAGSTDRLVQAFTDERVHTGQSPPELAAGLDALMQWIEKGTKPTAQSIAAACEQLRASLDGPCRYHPEYAPKPYATRYYTREAAVR